MSMWNIPKQFQNILPANQKHGGTRARQAGFTLLLTSLVASLMLTIAASMFTLVQKQIILSAIGRDSQFAFYAADSGAECALYWDFRHSAFSSVTPFTTAVCDGESLGTITFAGYGTPMEFEYEPNGYCARVSVTKAAPVNGVSRTTIYARGYSSSCASIETNARALERAVELYY